MALKGCAGAPHVEPQASARDIDRWLTKLDHG
jgi:hypothetical protein